MKLYLSDLTLVAEAAKGLKARTVLWFDNIVMAIDVESKYAIVYLDPSRLSTIPHRALQIDARELSAFMKSVILTEFELPDDTLSSIVTLDSGANAILHVSISSTNDGHAKYILRGINKLECFHCSEESDITEKFSGLYGLKKDSGSSLYTHNGYTMYLFSGILPLNKDDKLYLSIADLSPQIFNVRFRILKKGGLTIFIYLNFLKIC